MKILLIISIIFFIFGVICLIKSNKNISNNYEAEKKLKQKLLEEITELQNQKEKQLSWHLNDLQQLKLNLAELERQSSLQIGERREKKIIELTKWENSEKEKILNNLSLQKSLTNDSIKNAKKEAENTIQQINQQVENYKSAAEKEKNQINSELQKIKASLNAGIEARLREQQMEQKYEFYKLSISKEDLSDVQKLENLKLSFHKPVVLSKLIWSQYFQKKMTELCDRVLGKKVICGIYKITNLNTKQCYIGQSVDVATRFKQHCKCGLGIDAPASNILYNDMQKYGVWNYTFELIEKCKREELNEKEAFWIDTYQSNTYGLNTVKGHK